MSPFTASLPHPVREHSARRGWIGSGARPRRRDVLIPSVQVTAQPSLCLQSPVTRRAGLCAPLAGCELRVATRPEWVAAVRADLPAFLRDHAACERKAAAFVTHLIAHYPDVPWLVRPMIAVAREELQHFADVHKVMTARGIIPGPDEKDVYVRALTARPFTPGYSGLGQRLLVAGVIEARGAERFGLLAQGLAGEGLGAFYTKLTLSEQGHAARFIRLASRVLEPAEVHAELDALLDFEAGVVAELPLRARLH